MFCKTMSMVSKVRSYCAQTYVWKPLGRVTTGDFLDSLTLEGAMWRMRITCAKQSGCSWRGSSLCAQRSGIPQCLNDKLAGVSDCRLLLCLCPCLHPPLCTSCGSCLSHSHGRHACQNHVAVQILVRDGNERSDNLLKVGASGGIQYCVLQNGEP